MCTKIINRKSEGKRGDLGDLYVDKNIILN